MPGQGLPGGAGHGTPRDHATRVGPPEWSRDPRVSFDPEVAREARTRSPGGSGGRPAGPRPPLERRRLGGPLAGVGWPKRIGALLAVLLLCVVGFAVYLDTQMTRIEALGSYDDRPTSSGTNWLIVGSDSREGISEEAGEELSAGDAAGNRTDTMMLVHTSLFGQTSLVSLPRDSLVTVPGEGENRLNAAYSIGGPELLTQSVETATGLRIDHYAEIGFEGFAGMVDAVGGVEMCLDEPLDDPLAGIDLAAGCQELDGPNALGFVRSRAFPDADLRRVQNQRAFLAALVSEASSPLTLLNPFQSIPLANAGIALLTVDDSTHIWHLGRLAWAMRSLSGEGGVTTTVPLNLSSSVPGAVVWDDDDAERLFAALRSNSDIPSDLVTPGS